MIFILSLSAPESWARAAAATPISAHCICARSCKSTVPQPILNPDTLPDDASLVVAGNIGAPVVSIEKLPQGEEMSEAVRQLQNHIGRGI